MTPQLYYFFIVSCYLSITRNFRRGLRNYRGGGGGLRNYRGGGVGLRNFFFWGGDCKIFGGFEKFSGGGVEKFSGGDEQYLGERVESGGVKFFR